MVAKGWSKSKFRGEMCRELIEMFSQGKGRENFCAKHNICTRTFSEWLDKYPMFNDAYMIAHDKAMQYYNDLAQEHLIEEHEGAKLNTKVFNLIMRNRFNMPQNRFVKLQGIAKRSAQDKLDSICSAVEKGQLTAEEAQKLASIIDSTIKAAEYDELKARVEAIEQANKIGADDEDFKEVDVSRETITDDT